MSDTDSKAAKTFKLELHGDGQEGRRTMSFGLFVFGCSTWGAFQTFNEGGDARLLWFLGVMAWGGYEIAYGVWLWWCKCPAFDADRSGFRIRGRKKRPWGQFHGASVQVVKDGDGDRKVGERVQVRIKTSGLFQYRTVATVPQATGGHAMAYQINSFFAELKALWDAEDQRVDAIAAPGVAARNKALRERH